VLRRLSLGLLASAISVAALPAIAQEDGGADDLGVMSISLKDVVKPTFGFQGALQGAGTPNQAGIGGFLPLSVGENSVFFADVLLNANFADYGNYSSIINTTVAGTTISTSSRLGYRWLNNDRSWMYGINAGYDTPPEQHKKHADCRPLLQQSSPNRGRVVQPGMSRKGIKSRLTLYA
jgi:hypothetical protein